MEHAEKVLTFSTPMEKKKKRNKTKRKEQKKKKRERLKAILMTSMTSQVLIKVTFLNAN